MNHLESIHRVFHKRIQGPLESVRERPVRDRLCSACWSVATCGDCGASSADGGCPLIGASPKWPFPQLGGSVQGFPKGNQTLGTLSQEDLHRICSSRRVSATSFHFRGTLFPHRSLLRQAPKRQSAICQICACLIVTTSIKKKTGWWFLATPLKKMNEFVNWDEDSIPIFLGKSSKKWQPVTTNQY